MDFKEILIWLGVFIMGSLIVSAIISPGVFENFKESFKGLSKNPTEKNLVLDIVENPENYLGENLSLKDIYICYGRKIVAYREDGTHANLRYEYERSLNAYYKYDFYGGIESNLPESGIIPVDKLGNPIGITYWYRVDRAVQRNKIDVSAHPNFGGC